ncbi:NON-SPECIFIC LIPID-TRANSFER PROTEIN 8 [Salix koriyanagi]|uniref:Non-specific lipid-transfer protein n=1 Tax=Salix koriyanagi TaxID=2511006 RepID=A0A9Q0X5P7_9ROSI|nr:NON-SPECIFIC LIPID-TRANSFER PROTEIN 8 [Salix koriyanagi]
MNSPSIIVAAMAALMMFLLLTPPSDAAISCSDVIKNLRPCVNYLVKGSGKPPATCCSGVSAIQAAASTTADRQTACNCIKSASKQINPKPQLAQALPANCGITLAFTVSPNVDCSKVT